MFNVALRRCPLKPADYAIKTGSCTSKVGTNSIIRCFSYIVAHVYKNGVRYSITIDLDI